MKALQKKKAIFVVIVLLILAVLIAVCISNRAIILERTNQIFGIQREEEAITGETSIDPAKWDTNKVNIVYDTEGVAVPVPKGYVASGADGEHTVKEGFVIYEGEDEVTTENAWEESKTRNQWVWVPVPDASRIYAEDDSGKKTAKLWDYTAEGRSAYSNNNDEPGIITTDYDNEKYFAEYNLQGKTKDEFLEELQLEFEATIESIEKYGGFYIGRYETGNLTLNIPVVQRMNENISSQTWYEMYSKMKYLGANSNVKTNMIWGCLWDETLQWLVDSGNKTYAKIADSTTWGNHQDSEFDYTTASGSTATKASGSELKILTGSVEDTKSNNIYDLAGNVMDWTLEGSGTFGHTRGLRGGSYSYDATDYSSSYRFKMNPDFSNGIFGCRAYLYIK